MVQGFDAIGIEPGAADAARAPLLPGELAAGRVVVVLDADCELAAAAARASVLLVTVDTDEDSDCAGGEGCPSRLMKLCKASVRSSLEPGDGHELKCGMTMDDEL